MRTMTKKRARQINQKSPNVSAKQKNVLDKMSLASKETKHTQHHSLWKEDIPPKNLLHPNFHKRYAISKGIMVFSRYYVARNLVPSQANRGKTSQRLWQPEFCSWPSVLHRVFPRNARPSLRITRTCQKTHCCCTQGIALKQDSDTAITCQSKQKWPSENWWN